MYANEWYFTIQCACLHFLFEDKLVRHWHPKLQKDSKVTINLKLLWHWAQRKALAQHIEFLNSFVLGLDSRIFTSKLCGSKELCFFSRITINSTPLFIFYRKLGHLSPARIRLLKDKKWLGTYQQCSEKQAHQFCQR